jgi:hypothetical protein
MWKVFSDKANLEITHICEMTYSFIHLDCHCSAPTATEQGFPVEDLTPDYDFYEDNHDLDTDHGNLEVTPEMGDKYLRAEIFIPHGESLVKGHVTSCKKDIHGKPGGLANTNPILNTCTTFPFNNGDETILNANLIAEAKYVQCNPDRNQYVLLDSIINHRWIDTAIRPSDQKIVRPNGQTYMKRSTIGWHECCQWKDGSTSWENLADLKESHPLRQQNMPWPKALTMSQPLTGGFPMS